MTNEDLLQQILNSTIERLGRQAVQYEAEIANLNSQILILKAQVKTIEESVKEKPAKVSPLKE